MKPYFAKRLSVGNKLTLCRITNEVVGFRTSNDSGWSWFDWYWNEGLHCWMVDEPESLGFSTQQMLQNEFGYSICKPVLGFTIIGEISQEAEWVKEGDEFDEEEFEIESPMIGVPFKNVQRYQDFIKAYPQLIDTISVRIYNPSCKHFH